MGKLSPTTGKNLKVYSVNPQVSYFPPFGTEASELIIHPSVWKMFFEKETIFG
jgi:hypothetical protein